MDVSGKTRLLGVIGHPIEHSLSPRMHSASFAATELEELALLTGAVNTVVLDEGVLRGTSTDGA